MATALLCRDARCRTPVLTVEGGNVILKSRHHGEHHENRIGIVEIVETMVRNGCLPPWERQRLQELLNHE